MMKKKKKNISGFMESEEMTGEELNSCKVSLLKTAAEDFGINGVLV